MKAGDRKCRFSILAASVFCLAALFLFNKDYVHPQVLDNVPEITALHIKNPSAKGKTFKITGTLESSFKTKTGIVFLKIHNRKHNLSMNVVVFPNLGKMKTKLWPRSRIEVIGNLDFYKGKPQLMPLSIDHVILVDERINKKDAVALREISEKLFEKNVLVGPVEVLRAEPFISRKQKRHVRLTLADSTSVVNGIMFEGIWTESDLYRLQKLQNSQDKLFLIADIGTYRQQPSIIVRNLLPEEAYD